MDRASRRTSTLTNLDSGCPLYTECESVGLEAGACTKTSHATETRSRMHASQQSWVQQRQKRKEDQQAKRNLAKTKTSTDQLLSWQLECYHMELDCVSSLETSHCLGWIMDTDTCITTACVLCGGGHYQTTCPTAQSFRAKMQDALIIVQFPVGSISTLVCILAAWRHKHGSPAKPHILGFFSMDALIKCDFCTKHPQIADSGRDLISIPVVAGEIRARFQICCSPRPVLSHPRRTKLVDFQYGCSNKM